MNYKLYFVLAYMNFFFKKLILNQDPYGWNMDLYP